MFFNISVRKYINSYLVSHSTKFQLATNFCDIMSIVFLLH